ncbi:MAG: ABC transporter substrate binding protein [Nitrospirota bacterium]
MSIFRIEDTVSKIITVGELIIKKNIFLTICLSLALLFCSAFSEAYEVLVLKSLDIAPYNEALEGFKSSCDCKVRDLVFSEMEERDVSGKIHEIKPDAILAIGLDALAHAQLIKDLPVIYTMVPYHPPVVSERINISGVSMRISPEKYLDTMLAVFSDAKRIGVVYDPKNMDAFIIEALQLAQSKGINLVLKKTSSPGSVPSLIDGMKDKIDVLWMLPDTTVINSETINYMLLFSFQNKAPLFTFSKKYLEMGAVAALTIDPFDLGAQAGEIAKKLSAEGNVKTPVRINARKTVLSVNKKVAKKMGIRIREEIINRGNNE